MKKPLCRKCKTDKSPTKHHVYPRRWNKVKGQEFHPKLQGVVVPFCRDCHNKLEFILLTLERIYGRLPLKLYENLANHF